MKAPSVLVWFLPLEMVLAVALAALIVRGQPLGILGYVLGVLLVVPIAWVVISALWPASADRRCPACRADALERLDAASTTGLACRSCGWRDESASAWLLAEEEGPLEDIVLRQRGRRPSAAPKAPRSAVENTAAAD